SSASVRDRPPTTLVLLGKALHSRGASAQAATLLRQAQRRYPGDFWVNHELASCLHQMRPPQLDDAIRFYTAALALNSKSPGVSYNLGLALQHQGKVEEAIACYREAIRLKGDYAPAHTNLGNALRARGDVEGAIRSYRQAILLDPNDAKAHYNLGSILCDVKRDYDGALSCFQKALLLDPKFAQAHTNLGVALGAKGEVEGA